MDLPPSLTPVERAVAELRLRHGQGVPQIARRAGVPIGDVAALGAAAYEEIARDLRLAADRRHRIARDGVLLGLVAIAAALVASGADGPVRAVAVLLAMLLVPGGAVLTRFRVSEQLTWLGLAVGLSLAIGTVVATVLAWTGAWHPPLAGALVGAGSAGLLAVDLVRALRGPGGLPS